MNKNFSLLIHEWVTPNGGSEKVTLAISKIFKDRPDLLVLWDEKSDLEFTGQSWIARLTWLPKTVRATFSFLAHLTWRGEYELIICSSHLFAHGARVAGSRKSPKIAYVHTPARYIWDPEIDNRFDSRLALLSQFLLGRILKKIDLLMLSRNTYYIANSTFVRDRIKQHWGNESKVIHPPVNVEFFNNFFQENSPNELTLISAGRLVKYKRHDIAIRVASKMKCKVIIAGTGPEETFLRELANDLSVPVDFYPRPTDEKFADLLSKSSVLLNSGIEDFGIVPIEAMATGTPVVGLAQGGLLDTVSEQNGILVDSYEEFPNAIIKALELNRKNVMQTSLTFSEKAFQIKFAEFVSEIIPSCVSQIKDDFITKN